MVRIEMHWHLDVRTTLDIDNDGMEAARELARMHNESIGAVSSLAR